MTLAVRSAGATGVDTEVVPDPRIAELVGRVSVARLRAHVERLAAAPRDDSASRDAAAAYVASELRSYGYDVARTPVKQGLTSLQRRGRENVIARRPGAATPERSLVIGAHMDSVRDSPGADDNASGVAALLEIARALAGVRAAHTLELVALALEEEGLIGSAAHARSAGEGGRDLIGMVSLEMIGFTCAAPCQAPFRDIPGCLDVDDDAPTAGDWIGVTGNRASRALKKSFLAAAARYVPALAVKQGEVDANGSCFPDTRRSDHAPFWDRGFPALLITDTAEFRNPNYHQTTDTPATLDYDFAARVAQATVAFAALAVDVGGGGLPRPSPSL